VHSELCVVAVGGDSFGTQEGERQPLEADTRGLVRDSRPRGLSVCSEMSSVRNTDTVCNSDSNRP
jgi:hypothetical protein